MLRLVIFKEIRDEIIRTCYSFQIMDCSKVGRNLKISYQCKNCQSTNTIRIEYHQKFVYASYFKFVSSAYVTQ